MITKDGTVSKFLGKFHGYTLSKEEEEEEPEKKGSKEAPEKGPNYEFLSYAVSDSDSDLESTARIGPKCNELEDTCENFIVGSKDGNLCWFDMDLSSKPYKIFITAFCFNITAFCSRPPLRFA
ncbi:putative reverse transcriptase domain-containing protein [Tanacetum coccineum]